MLFIDLSGYSKITSVLADRGAYLLSKIVNSYLAELLRVVNLFGGDVVNFAGDAVMVVWESDSIEYQKMNVVCAGQCAMQLQELTGDYPIEGTDLYFRIHCGITCGELDTEVFTAPRSAHMQSLYHVVSGEPLVEIGGLVDSAKAGEVYISWDCADYLLDYAVFGNEGENGMRLINLSLDPETDQAVDSHIDSLRKQRAALRVEKIEEHFIHPSVISHLQHGGTQIAQMRNLCVLFVAKTSSGNSANWLMEVHVVLDRHRCPIVQIIDDDKGVHLTAAVNLYESVPEATKLAINACRELMSKQIGCAIGMAMGGTYCGVTGSAEIACRWDITGAPVVRAARLMQYAVNEDIPIAIDQSVYDNAAFSTMMEQFSCIYVKGCQVPIKVYQMSPSKSVAASMILENFAFAPIHQEQVSILEAFLSSNESRGAAIVTGPSLVGKKVVCQRAAGLAKLVPILHVSDATAGLFQLGRTLADWFLHYFDKSCCNGAREVKHHIENHRWNRAHDECVKLINTVIMAGYRGCVVVDRVHDLDQFSLSFMRKCLVDHRLPRKSFNRSSSTQSSILETRHENGKFFFLCTHEPLYDAKSARCILSELVRAHRLDVPVVEVVESTREDLKILVRDSIDLGVDEYWLDINAETSGFRCGYMFQRIRRLRVMSANFVKEGKTPLSTISEDLKLYIPDRMSLHVKAVTVDQVNPDTAMRFGRVYDELPPCFQTFVQVITVATIRCLYKVPLKAVAMAMDDLFDDSEGVGPFPFDIAVAELEELFILKIEGEGEFRRVYLRCPAFRDTAAAVCTPAQFESIALALIDRIDECDHCKTFVDHLIISGLAGRLGDVALQYDHWKHAYAKLQKESKHMDEESINRCKLLIEEEIDAVGVVSMKYCLGIESLDIRRPTFSSLNPTTELLKYYGGPVTFGPMGHTLSVISRNCFKERRAYNGATDEEVAKLRQDISSGVSRCRSQIHLVESYLEQNGLGSSRDVLHQELEILERFNIHVVGEHCSNTKADLFLNHLIPKHIEPRMQRLRRHVEMLRTEQRIPEAVKEAEDAIRLAYIAMLDGDDQNDAIQDALVTLASLNWAPKKVPECLPVFFYNTVATIRYRLMRILSDGELILFRHQHIFDDLGAFLILTALLPEHDQPRVI